MKAGKHSTNPRLQSLLSCINRTNLTFFHNSAKLGHHLIPDKLSRVASLCWSQDCSVKQFLSEIPLKVECFNLSILGNNNLTPTASSLTMSPSTLAATFTDLQKMLMENSGPIPLGSRNVWKQLQLDCPDCVSVINKLKLVTPRCEKKDSRNVKSMLPQLKLESKHNIDLLVSREFDPLQKKEISRVFVPQKHINYYAPQVDASISVSTKESI